MSVEITDEVSSREETRTLEGNVSGAEDVVGTIGEDRMYARTFNPTGVKVVWKRTPEEPEWRLWRATLSGPRTGAGLGFWSSAHYGHTSSPRHGTDYITRAPQWLQDFVAVNQPAEEDA